MRHRPAVAALAVVLAVVACGGRRGSVVPTAPAFVVFENQSLFEATVFATARGGVPRRVGIVSPNRTDTLALTGDVLAVGGAGGVTISVRLLADRRTPSTGPLTVRPGDRFRVTLPTAANMLSVVPEAPALVVFENQSLFEATVFATARGGVPRRVGIVAPNRTETLALRGDVLAAGGAGGVTITARLLADRRVPSTGPLTVRSGDRFRVTLPAAANTLSVVPDAP